jgi:U6 snRNA-associated Sm-like protein LSm7
MADRGSHRGGGRGGGGHRGGRGGGRGGPHGGGGGPGNQAGGERERPKKENILDLGKYMDKKITVKFNGGREGRHHPSVARGQVAKDADMHAVTGTLKGYDALMNLVLDDVEEVMRGESDSSVFVDRTLTKISQMTRATRRRARSAWSSQEAHYSSSSAPSTAASRSPTPSPSPKTIELGWHDGRGSNTQPAQGRTHDPTPMLSVQPHRLQRLSAVDRNAPDKRSTCVLEGQNSSIYLTQQRISPIDVRTYATGYIRRPPGLKKTDASAVDEKFTFALQ